MDALLANRKIAAATHNIMAYRIVPPGSKGVVSEMECWLLAGKTPLVCRWHAKQANMTYCSCFRDRWV